jgi:hypothetical protein
VEGEKSQKMASASSGGAPPGNFGTTHSTYELPSSLRSTLTRKTTATATATATATVTAGEAAPTFSFPITVGEPKRPKPTWPPVREGLYFFVQKEDAEKWPPKKHTTALATAKFTVTSRGVKCCEVACRNPGFAEVNVGETNHVSSLHFCLKHVVAFHPPPKKEAPSLFNHYSKKKINHEYLLFLVES